MPVLTIGSKRILYIHVPKTGGTSVEYLLRSYGGDMSMSNPWGWRAGFPCTPQHYHGELLRLIFGLNLDNLAYGAVDGKPGGREHDFDFIFMTVRHPMSRLLSEYRYQRSAYQGEPFRSTWRAPRNRAPVARMLNFDLWCRYALRRYSQNPFIMGNHLRPQVEFSVWNPVVYRLEDGLEAIRERLDALIDARGALPVTRQNASTDLAGSPEKISKGTRRLINAHISSDLATYGYESRETD